MSFISNLSRSESFQMATFDQKTVDSDFNAANAMLETCASDNETIVLSQTTIDTCSTTINSSQMTNIP